MLFVQIYLIQMCDQQAPFLIIRAAKFHYEHIMGFSGREASWEDISYILQPFSRATLRKPLQHWTVQLGVFPSCIGQARKVIGITTGKGRSSSALCFFARWEEDSGKLDSIWTFRYLPRTPMLPCKTFCAEGERGEDLIVSVSFKCMMWLSSSCLEVRWWILDSWIPLTFSNSFWNLMGWGISLYVYLCPCVQMIKCIRNQTCRLD